jgi:two-component sensor histidine kinase
VSIVRKKARELTGADGATFVLRDGSFCYYVDEDAIAPLWKGKRFPMEICISGWVMLNRQPAIIKDIYADARIPVEAYRPTFVKSLAMVPIRTASPIGAIGNYWASIHEPSVNEVKILQGLADSTSIAMENVRLYSELEDHLKNITQQEEKYRHLSEKLQDSLTEKVILLKEIYHRVKNNLQVITSLLNLQSEMADVPSIREALITSAARVKSMALVHEMLYQHENLAKISMQDYIDTLIKYLREIYNGLSDKIQFKKEINPITLNIDEAIPCGLIINEVVSNAFKHAFPNNQSGEIQISLKEVDNQIALIINDNGVGITPDLDPQNTPSLGLKLMHNLTRQLNGKIILERKMGTMVTLFFSSHHT